MIHPKTADLQKLADACEGLAVHPDTYTQIGAALVQIKGQHKALKSEKDEQTAGLRAQLKEASAFFSDALAAVERGEAATKAKIVAYLEAYEKARDKAAETGGLIPAPPPDLPGVSVRESWAFEVINPRLLPAELLQPNERAIGELVKQSGQQEPDPIPGVKFRRQKILAVRG